MGSRWVPVAGIVLVLVGLLGVTATTVALRGDVERDVQRRAPGERKPGQFTALGERIYTQGTGADGQRVPRSGGMMGRACVDCHGPDGRGRDIGMMMGRVRTPDIRYSTLTSEHTAGTETVPAWTDEDIVRAVRDGVEPDGEPLRPPMPRWQLNDAEMEALLAYLKQL